MSEDDARLVRLYDEDNPDGADHAFYRALADRLQASDIADVGCGTGILTVTLSAAGRRVTGIDPSAAMLDFARGRPGGDGVTWVRADASALAPESADLVTMTGNVAQHIPTSAWSASLSAIRAGLRPGGVLAFETRNPTDRAWARWSAEPRATRTTRIGILTEWMEVSAPDVDGGVAVAFHTEFESGELLVHHQVLVFRTAEAVRADLETAGFADIRMHGGWADEPLTDGSRLIVVQASRPR